MIEREKTPHPNNEFEELLVTIPFERCKLIQNSVTGRFEFEAPANMKFQIEGHFVVRTDSQSPDIRFSRPDDSRARFFELYKDQIKELLLETGGNEEEAVEILLDNLMIFPEELEMPEQFTGKYLSISPWFDQNESPDGHTLENPVLTIREVVDATAQNEDYIAFISDLSQNSDSEIMFEKKMISIDWWQRYAEAIPGKCTITLVEAKDDIPEFFVIHAEPPLDEIYQEFSLRRTKTENADIKF